MISRFDVVLFDAGGTLLHPFPSVGQIYSEVAARYDCFAEAPYLEQLFREVWLERDGLVGLESHSDEKVEKEWWRGLVQKVFSDLGGIENFEVFFEELYELFGHPDVWKLYPEVPEVLAELRARGKRLGIVSNWDSRLFKLCEGFELGKYFDFVIASAAFGASKPSPRIFEEALRRAGVEAGRAVHVGDSFEDDVRGARGAGIEGILINRHPETRHFENITVITSLRELLA